MNRRLKPNSLLFFVIAMLFALSTYSGIYRINSVVFIGITYFFLLAHILLDLKKIIIRSWSIWAFIMICIISILINNPPSYFRAWERLALFINILLAFSPIIVTRRLTFNRVLLYKNIIIVMMLYSSISFWGYFAGINFFVYKGDLLDMYDAGHFSGFANHSMTLAPISALSGIYAYTKFFYYKRNIIKRILWLIIACLCFGSVLLSASRGALIGSMLALIVATYRINSGRITNFIKYVTVCVSIGLLTFPAWSDLTQYVLEKNEYNISQGGVIYSRETKMEARQYEIKHYFFTGVGFSTVDESVDTVDRESGTIEPNSSWLGVFSMTGVFGFLFFVWVYLNAFRKAYIIKNNCDSAMMCGILGFFFIHLMIEGYVLAGGSFLCGMYWLTIGVIHALSDHN